jgi:plasmid stabilization system protein ParE
LVADNFNLSRSALGEILARLRSLRASLTKARDALVHFKDDRVDRDRLEPAARRVDELMNLFASGSRNPEQGSRFVAEIQNDIEQVTNSKSADALRAAQVEIGAMLDAMRTEGPGG